MTAADFARPVSPACLTVAAWLRAGIGARAFELILVCGTSLLLLLPRSRLTTLLLHRAGGALLQLFVTIVVQRGAHADIDS